MLGHERLELAHELGVAAAGEIGVDPVLERADPHVLEPSDRGPRERLRGEVGQRGAAPELERGAEPAGRILVVSAGGRLGCFRGPALEPAQVELVRREPNEIAGGTSLDD